MTTGRINQVTIVSQSTIARQHTEVYIASERAPEKKALVIIELVVCLQGAPDATTPGRDEIISPCEAARRRHQWLCISCLAPN